MVQMGKRIHEKRKYFGYTLDEVAERVDIPKTTLSRLENGKLKTINRGYIDRLAKLFGCDAAYLLGYEDAPTVNLQYSAPGKETVNMYETVSIDKKPIIGESAKRAALYAAALNVLPQNLDIAIELLKTLSKKE